MSSIFYCITEKYVCVDYLCCLKTKLHVTGRGQGSESIRYFSVSGIFIPEILMNIISCHGFVNNTKSAVILSCCRKLVDYYLQFFFHENNSNGFKNVPIGVKQKTNIKHFYKNDSIKECYREIPSTTNTLKNHHHMLSFSHIICINVLQW